MAMPNQMTQMLMVISYLDESMHYLYNTPLLKYMEDWLDSYDIDLLTTGVLALGNFARTDSHCIEMVERNVTTKLLGTYTKLVSVRRNSHTKYRNQTNRISFHFTHEQRYFRRTMALMMK